VAEKGGKQEQHHHFNTGRKELRPSRKKKIKDYRPSHIPFIWQNAPVRRKKRELELTRGVLSLTHFLKRSRGGGGGGGGASNLSGRGRTLISKVGYMAFERGEGDRPDGKRKRRRKGGRGNLRWERICSSSDGK